MVIAVIALLAALLLPSLQGARFKARSVVCVSNYRQLGLAVLTYGGDYRGWLPYCDLSPNTPTPWDFRSFWYYTMHDGYGVVDDLFWCSFAKREYVKSVLQAAARPTASNPAGEYQNLYAYAGTLYVSEGGKLILPWYRRKGWSGCPGDCPGADVGGPQRVDEGGSIMNNPIFADGTVNSTWLGPIPVPGGSALDNNDAILLYHRLNGKNISATELWADGHAELVPATRVFNRFWEAWR